jgi:hypothetical protein
MMESLQTQVTSLDDKVDSLYQMIERLSLQITEILQVRGFPSAYGGEPRAPGILCDRISGWESSEMSLLLEHKDVLMDEDSLEIGFPCGERELTPEVQIQRLTAQLTAAYNRIAALEEQLLARRVH